MARRTPRPTATATRTVPPGRARCWACGGPAWTVFHAHRTVTTLAGVLHLTLPVRRCQRPTGPRSRRSRRPEADGRLALPQGEFGLDGIALLGLRRSPDHRRGPEIHRDLGGRGVVIAARPVTTLRARSEARVTRPLRDEVRRRHRPTTPGRGVLGIDGRQPAGGHAVLWVVRDGLSGVVRRARRRRRAPAADRAPLLTEVRPAPPVPVRGVIADGPVSLRPAVAAALPGVPHRLGHVPSLRQAALPVAAADRPAPTEVPPPGRGGRPIARPREADPAADRAAVRASGPAVRRAITDAGRPPRAAAGRQRQQRRQARHDALGRVAEPRGARGR
jgi:hypothetical protein